MTFCRSCQSLAGFQLMAAFSDCVNFMTTHCSVFFSSTVSVSIVLFMHYMIKIFPVFLSDYALRFKAGSSQQRPHKQKTLGFLCLDGKNFVILSGCEKHSIGLVGESFI